MIVDLPVLREIEALQRKQRDEAMSERGSTTAFRNMIAKEIWAYNECPWDFDTPPEGMAQLQKQLAVDQAERIRDRLFTSELLKGYVRFKAIEEKPPEQGPLDNSVGKK